MRLQVDLHPVSPLTLTIHTPAGSPAPGAKVALADSESVIRLYDRAVQSEAGGVLFRADDKGKLKLSSVDSVDKLIVVHESGYTAIDPKKMGLGTVIQLHPWARITGIYREKDRPVEGRAFRLESMPGEEAGLILGLDAFRVESDVDGRFAFPPVPAGTYRIVKMKWSKRPDGTRGWSRRATTKVEARSGKRVTLELTE